MLASAGDYVGYNSESESPGGTASRTTGTSYGSRSISKTNSPPVIGGVSTPPPPTHVGGAAAAHEAAEYPGDEASPAAEGSPAAAGSSIDRASPAVESPSPARMSRDTIAMEAVEPSPATLTTDALRQHCRDSTATALTYVSENDAGTEVLRLRVELKEKDDALAALQEKVTQASALRDEVTVKQREIDDLTRVGSQKEDEISSLKKLLELKDEMLKTKESQCEAQGEELRRLRKHRMPAEREPMPQRAQEKNCCCVM